MLVDTILTGAAFVTTGTAPTNNDAANSPAAVFLLFIIQNLAFPKIITLHFPSATLYRMATTIARERKTAREQSFFYKYSYIFVELL